MITCHKLFLCSVPQDYKLNPGAVEAVLEQPGEPDSILIGYNRGLIVLWNRTENTAVRTFINNQQLESFCWGDQGKTFISSHNDGSYMVWDVEDGEKPVEEAITTYGPFPCKAIPKILTRDLNDSRLIAFTGGLPRASYGDKYTVSCIHDTKHAVFDFTSKVIDFLFIDSEVRDENEEDAENEVNGDAKDGQVEALVVLAEEELVVIDLLSEDWKMMNLPYLVSLHASAVTCSQHVSGKMNGLFKPHLDSNGLKRLHTKSSRNDQKIKLLVLKLSNL